MKLAIEPLTRDQIGQLRAATHIGFARSPQAAYIVAEKGDNRHRVQVADRVHALGGSSLDAVAYCSHSLCADIGTGWPRAWRTAATFLRAGDQLMLDWFRDGESGGHLRGTDLHGDRLSLIVARGGQTYEFILAVEINEDTTSRMILTGRNGS